MVRPIATEQVRVESLRVSSRPNDEGRRLLRFTLSEDVMAHLYELHDKLYSVWYYGDKSLKKRFRQNRMQFVRFRDLGIPAVFMRIEAPSINPTGRRIWQPHNSRQYNCQVMAAEIRVKDNIPSRILEQLWMDDISMLGVMLTFPDEDMKPPGTKPPVMHKHPKSRQPDPPPHPDDLTVR
jgi:hypothetical protein